MTTVRIRATCIFGMAVLGAICVATAAPAAAAGGQHGQLELKALGSVYDGPNGGEVVVTNPGGAVTFSVKLSNTGTSTSQYNLSADLSGFSCDPSGCPKPTLAVVTGTLGSTNVTPYVTGPNGYFTPPLRAGRSTIYTLKLGTPKTAVADNEYGVSVSLSDTAGNLLSRESVLVMIKDTTGTSDFDEFLTGSGAAGPVQAPGTAFNSANNTTNNGVVAASTAPISVGQTATFTVKLQNDSSSPSSIGYGSGRAFDLACLPSWQVTAKVGTVDVTAAVANGTYQTPVLAPGASTTLTISMKLMSSLGACGSDSGAWVWTSYSMDSSGNQAFASLVVPVTAAAEK